MNKQLITYIIPACNEEGNVEAIYKEIRKHHPQKYQVEYIYVDDGSTDKTLEKIQSLVKKDQNIKYLSFTRNFGHQYAIKAGLDFASGDAVISLDADLQHPPQLIPKMIALWEKGNKIVYTKRTAGTYGTAGKNITSQIFYKFINSLSETKIDPGSADFRLLDKEVVELIKKSEESTLFLRGLVAWSGYKNIGIEYKPNKRVWGKTKYSYTKMIQLAIDAITSFSIFPLRLATIIGMVMSLLSGVYGLYAVAAWITNKTTVIIGWPSVIISVLFIGGLQLMILGIIGEYIGKIFMETKNRPLYIVKEKNI